ncbi:RNA/RNP complex-1-interacting phosphatase-like isoform X2 [Dicentrarchus labrax]|uniref:RNA/RNP complex-1-interacting phosphatase-like isoform X2 n=1 Tax=Dicentrarchus labrax TaxID=13489 RepID=UPI0021F5FEE4|nr:RNA/RNP complex-1-interacting phosphatase-like isoform X2 [Dicentrarchus labrax]
MPHDKKKKRKKTGVPDRWLDYRPVGQRIPGTRFIAFKVPLKPSLNRQVPASQSFGLWDLLDQVESQNQELGLIIDLTFTTRYYGLSDVPQSCSYVKILTEGRHVPSDATILSFKRAVRRFLKENWDNDKLIGVHCTHGLNRTGYLVCRYLIDVEGMDAATALELFNSCRGHHIERQNYLNDLQRGAKRSNAGINEPEEEAARGLAAEKPPQTGTTDGERPPQTGTTDGERPPQTGTGDERRPAGDDSTEEKRAGSRRGPRHRRQVGQAAMGGLHPTPALLPTPLVSYVWSPSAPATLARYSWSDMLSGGKQSEDPKPQRHKL